MQDLGISSLGPFPILQIAAAMAILAGLALAIYRGTRDRKLSTDQENLPISARWYFDGPLNAALETLRDIYRVMASVDNEVKTLGEELRTHSRLLRDIEQKLVEIKDVEMRREGHRT